MAHWSPPLWDLDRLRYRTLIASATCDLNPLYRTCGCFRYVRLWSPLLYVEPWLLPLCGTFATSDLVVSATWDLCCFSWSSPLRGTFVASVGRLRYGTMIASATWGLLPLLRRLCYVHLFQTGLALGHVPALLSDRSSLRART